MPAQRKYENPADQRVHQLVCNSVFMMTEMHGALSEISKSDNPEQMKMIADQTLENVQNIAFGKPLIGGKANV